jgi:hypothetical protein
LGINAVFSGPYTGEWGGGIYPSSNQETRLLLESDNGELKNLFALSLDNGNELFTPAVGYGGVEHRDADSGITTLQTGPVPAVKTFADGSEVAYISFRSGQGDPPDGRWDSHMGEMVLDDQTVPGLVAGDMRFVQFENSYIHITDEQTPLTLAGETIFHAHWGASESTNILDRSNSRGLSYDNPIRSEPNPIVIRRIDACPNFDPITHWASCGLELFVDTRYWNGPGWWVYWNTMDPPTPNSSAYQEGILPRYTYVSDGLIVVEGNGGDLFVLTHSGP